jgi:hypothetical protein
VSGPEHFCFLRGSNPELSDVKRSLKTVRPT